MREHPGKLPYKAVPGAPRTGSRVSPGVVPRPAKTTGAGRPAPVDRYARSRARWAATAGNYARRSA